MLSLQPQRHVSCYVIYFQLSKVQKVCHGFLDLNVFRDMDTECQARFKNTLKYLTQQEDNTIPLQGNSPLPKQNYFLSMGLFNRIPFQSCAKGSFFENYSQWEYVTTLYY